MLLFEEILLGEAEIGNGLLGEGTVEVNLDSDFSFFCTVEFDVCHLGDVCLA